jgi:hypothetical protein
LKAVAGGPLFTAEPDEFKTVEYANDIFIKANLNVIILRRRV